MECFQSCLKLCNANPQYLKKIAENAVLLGKTKQALTILDESEKLCDPEDWVPSLSSEHIAHFRISCCSGNQLLARNGIQEFEGRGQGEIAKVLGQSQQSLVDRPKNV